MGNAFYCCYLTQIFLGRINRVYFYYVYFNVEEDSLVQVISWLRVEGKVRVIVIFVLLIVSQSFE